MPKTSDMVLKVDMFDEDLRHCAPILVMNNYKLQL